MVKEPLLNKQRSLKERNWVILNLAILIASFLGTHLCSNKDKKGSFFASVFCRRDHFDGWSMPNVRFRPILYNVSQPTGHDQVTGLEGFELVVAFVKWYDTVKFSKIIKFIHQKRMGCGRGLINAALWHPRVYLPGFNGIADTLCMIWSV